MSHRNLFVALFVLAILGCSYSFLVAQTPPNRLPETILQEGSKDTPAIRPIGNTASVPTPGISAAPSRRVPAVFDRFRSPDSSSESTWMSVKAARLGMDWLFRMQQPNGLFITGYNPALNQPTDGDQLTRQAIAACALAHAARSTGENRYTARAAQAILTLLSETTLNDAGIRTPNTSANMPSKLAFTGMLLRAICLLPEPAEDMIAKAEELAQYLKSLLQADGSFKEEPGDNLTTAGMAVYGLVASQKLKPADWKLQALRSTGTYYRTVFRSNPSPAQIGWMGPAYAEAFQLARETPFAEFVFEMNDWLCALQFTQTESKYLIYRGGFRWGFDVKHLEPIPTLDSAQAVLSLSEAYKCMGMLQKPDAARLDKYKQALMRGCGFLERLQYSEDRTSHFVPTLRAYLIGAFFNNPTDGNIRIDQTSMACMALTQFLASGAER
ncbi:hypothetical protein KIH39_13930 [Telmatocola sphagniphila]|uniref:Uncharacterized protein n=1 Tax=Telmatocola sphagniphila TaxID=1123043 RepID=A0A8E6B1D9_9BACT|nr:hypothetical protein [Telmatocola sphagniphila]QVL29967.1 hypothetical protein KIH39_13930 [Telmatocola sphagniphila]